MKADLALRAVADAEGVEATDEDVDDEIVRLAERLKARPEGVRRDLDRAEQLPAVRSDIRKGKALGWLVDHAEVVDEEGRLIDRAELEPAQIETAQPEPDEPQPDESTEGNPA